MNSFFALLLLASLLLLITGISSPTTSLFWNKEKRTRKQSVLIYGGLAILFFILFGATSENVKEEKQGSQENLNQAVVSSNAGNSTSSDNQETGQALFNSTEEFKDAFNQYCASNQLDFRVNSLKIKQNKSFSLFTYMLNENLGLTGNIDKSTGGIKEVAMFGTGDGTSTSGSNIILCMVAIIATVDPTIPAQSRYKILKKLKLFDKNVNRLDMSQETLMNGIKYSYISNSIVGISFVASIDTDSD
ncbi:hypothetical protein [uncultured Mucilaginibacter sp.]|uniref:hypothetical protein n=1 Tax=uncultured Mucilaginibacter sp. TaxID=797541 RepID=UPI00261DD2ED|nr:hypothetical protein [uncultured Mucilaginibacter sp.]